MDPADREFGIDRNLVAGSHCLNSRFTKCGLRFHAFGLEKSKIHYLRESAICYIMHQQFVMITRKILVHPKTPICFPFPPKIRFGIFPIFRIPARILPIDNSGDATLVRYHNVPRRNISMRE